MTAARPIAEDLAALAGRRRALGWIALATLGALSVWFSTNAVAGALADAWGGNIPSSP